MALVNSFARFAAATYPPEADVAVGVTYGDSLNAFTGSLDVDTSANIPSEDDVRDGVTFGSGNALTGNVTLPIEGNVRSGITYGANDNEFTGTMPAGSNVVIPSVTDVLAGVVYGEPLNPLTGNVVLPPVEDVKFGVGYGASGTTYYGTYQPQLGYNVQTENKSLTRGDDASLEWSTDGSWEAEGTLLFGASGLMGLIEVPVTIIDADTVVATLTSAETDALRGQYQYDVQMTDLSGNVSHIARGELFVHETETDIPTNTPMPQGRPT